MRQIIICAPVTTDAMKRLDFDSCLEGDLEEISIPEKNLELLWGIGLFNELNECLDLLIDDYEDESIPYEKLKKAIKILQKYIDQGLEIKYLIKINEIFKIALDNKTNVFLYF